ncbi:MAG: hypothetical protein HY429_00935 [Candidatus Levybacteria bacterium]|nr:hypothetical protein [Candidatus Daviesbacteria bacterium]MBI4078843.1 hypothetical protein [Candidatus Levybacteria bacterium]
MAIDWTKIYKKYKGLWVALQEDEKTVIASGNTAKETWDKARKKGFLKPILTRMPPKLIPYVGYGVNEI